MVKNTIYSSRVLRMASIHMAVHNSRPKGPYFLLMFGGGVLKKVAHTFNSSPWQAETSLVYLGSSRAARTV